MGTEAARPAATKAIVDAAQAAARSGNGKPGDYRIAGERGLRLSVSPDDTGTWPLLYPSVLPKSERVAVLYSEPDTFEPELRELVAQGRQVGLDVVRYPIRTISNWFSSKWSIGKATRCISRRAASPISTAQCWLNCAWHTSCPPSMAFVSLPKPAA
jgi:hypothetical protein